jgi:hypothetical protein
MSSLEFVSYRTTRDFLRKMATDGVFQAVGNDNLRGICSEAVTGRFAQRRTEERGGSDRGETNLVLPGILIMWAGHNRPESAGEIDYDDGIITMIIQIVDTFDRNEDNDSCIESYMRWLTDIREGLQSNPYRNLDQHLGDIYFVHVKETVAPEFRSYVIDEARLVLTLNLFTRTRRDIGVKNHDA